MRICRGWQKAIGERRSYEDAPFDTHPSIHFATQETRCSESGSLKNSFGSQKLKKKVNLNAPRRGLSAKLSKAGCWRMLPSTRLSAAQGAPL